MNYIQIPLNHSNRYIKEDNHLVVHRLLEKCYQPFTHHSITDHENGYHCIKFPTVFRHLHIAEIPSDIIISIKITKVNTIPNISVCAHHPPLHAVSKPRTSGYIILSFFAYSKCPPIAKLLFGSVAFAKGCFVVGTASSEICFVICSESWLLIRRR